MPFFAGTKFWKTSGKSPPLFELTGKLEGVDDVDGDVNEAFQRYIDAIQKLTNFNPFSENYLEPNEGDMKSLKDNLYEQYNKDRGHSRFDKNSMQIPDEQKLHDIFAKLNKYKAKFKQVKDAPKSFAKIC